MKLERRHFLAVVSKDEAERTWHAALRPEPLGAEDVPTARAHGRVLASEVAAETDLPPFDRSLVDGFAVVASDTFGADEAERRLRVASPALAAGDGRSSEVAPGATVEVATGAPLPRGADAVVMVEHVEREPGAARIGRAVVPGEGVQYAGSDVRRGEIVFRRGQRLGARETGVLAGLGVASVPCFRRPRVAVISTGDELVAPGGALRHGQIFDSNGRILADLIRENGGEPVELGIAPDRPEALRALLETAREHDAIVLSGGTSKGAGDLTYELVHELGKPGILVHGVAVKPGKPTVLAAWGRKPVVVLPGFPSSCALTFDAFAKPVIRVLAGLDQVEARDLREATLATTTPAGGGRHEFVLCHLVHPEGDTGAPVAFPVLKGSGSVSAFAQADGFFEVPASRDRVERGERVLVTLLDPERRAADLVLAGSGCPFLDRVLGLLRERHGLRARLLSTGSRAGLQAVQRGEADLAPFHAVPLPPGLSVVRGWLRREGIAARPGVLGAGADPEEWVLRAREQGLRVANRNAGSGTRVLLDALLEGAARRAGASDPAAWARSFPGASVLSRSQAGAVAAVGAGVADFTVAIEPVARAAGLEFLFLREETFDFAVSPARLGRAAVRALVELLASDEVRSELGRSPGFAPPGTAAGPVPG